MKWEHVAYRMTIFSVILFLSPYLDRMGNSYWLNLLYIVVLVLGIDFTLSKIKFLQICNKKSRLVYFDHRMYFRRCFT